jgi:Domain of unknown function (DUF4145)
MTPCVTLRIVADDGDKLEIVKARCSSCGGSRNHEVIATKTVDDSEEEIGYYGRTEYQIVRCQGCEDVRFRTSSINSEDLDEEGHSVETVQVYPDNLQRGRPANKELIGLPSAVGAMYREALGAFNAGAKVLAGGGLRAIVEAICKDRSIKGKNLQEKIDRLVGEGLLAKPQADLLHEERYLGNAALHELEAPADSDLTLGFEIIEALLITIYVLPAKAKRLQRNRLESKTEP